MLDLLTYFGCGLTAGLLGGYLGLGGGVVMVPYLVVLAGQNIKAAVPVSIAAIAVNSLSSSTEYLKKGMVDLELVVLLAISLTIGNIFGSSALRLVPMDAVQILFTIVLVYTAVVFLKGRKKEDHPDGQRHSGGHMVLAVGLALAAGLLGGLVGVGGGVLLVPALFLVLRLPLTTSRGTMTFMFGFSAAASTVVFLLLEQIDFTVVGPVVFGILFGARLGGLLGTSSKPLTVRIIFFVVLMYLAVRLGWEPMGRLLG